ncbi:hypothetical protein V494_06672 [Pseudogymnoascus sp. VKM F-4513 (FW-928)]|nr:hypothetical protein V494_06672 [Pseudogymnoascus sp. VKM F-4513 (FW-928)]
MRDRGGKSRGLRTPQQSSTVTIRNGAGRNGDISQTEWTISGQCTGSTDIPLTAVGESQVVASSKVVVGSGKLIDPSKLTRVFISPRTRAQRTYDLLFSSADRASLKDKVEITEDIREWEYGAYEGVTPSNIRKLRKEKGLDTERPWDIWHDGCGEGEGESPIEVATRLDELIAKIKQLQAPCMDGWGAPADVVIIAHGHSLRAFAKRWIGFEMGMRLPLMLEPGAVGVLSYEHHKVDEPALLLGVNMGASE